MATLVRFLTTENPEDYPSSELLTLNFFLHTWPDDAQAWAWRLDPPAEWLSEADRVEVHTKDLVSHMPNVDDDDPNNTDDVWVVEVSQRTTRHDRAKLPKYCEWVVIAGFTRLHRAVRDQVHSVEILLFRGELERKMRLSPAGVARLLHDLERIDVTD